MCGAVETLSAFILAALAYFPVADISRRVDSRPLRAARYLRRPPRRVRGFGAL